MQACRQNKQFLKKTVCSTQIQVSTKNNVREVQQNNDEVIKLQAKNMEFAYISKSLYFNDQKRQCWQGTSRKERRFK